jgi:hypothetical protein
LAIVIVKQLQPAFVRALVCKLLEMVPEAESGDSAVQGYLAMQGAFS